MKFSLTHDKYTHAHTVVKLEEALFGKRKVTRDEEGGQKVAVVTDTQKLLWLLDPQGD